ncbi:MAG: twin-arginine translocase subunit TatC [Cellvibrionaceae bacterium]|nr:twin-arginine translocase subunit TatC [Cellvibrionaceae bacterium]
MTQKVQEEELESQPLVQHLIELRSRLLRALLAVLVVFLALFNFSNQIYDFISEPLQVFLHEDAQMIATDVASPFLTPFKLTIFCSVVIAIPFIFYQLWLFIAPAMYKNEKKLALPLFASSVLLFYLGMSFAYFVVFPLVFGFFTSVAPESVTVMTDISKYLSFVIKLFFAFGFAFEIPVATVLLATAGVISPQNLAKKRPYVVVACFVVGMLLTPPDIISQALLALPMWLLFELGIIFSKIILRNKQQPGPDTDTAAD